MQYLNDVGIVVKRVNLNEADRFLTIFTKNYGKVEVLAKGVRKITSKRSSHVELLNLIKFNSVKTSKNFILTEVTLLNPFEKRKIDLKQCEIAFFVCELLDSLCPYGLINQELFLKVNLFLSANDFDDISILNFETTILTLLGYWNSNKSFTKELDARNFIESIIERKIKSRIIGNLDVAF